MSSSASPTRLNLSIRVSIDGYILFESVCIGLLPSVAMGGPGRNTRGLRRVKASC
ncbi:hypothetical protein BS47DRAFT_1338119, partial [Hydnum rufescens UP504]